MKVIEILDTYSEGLMSYEKLHKYLIEICELQKEECASKVIDHYKQFITNSKNIAK